jgi:hypothetical protein
MAPPSQSETDRATVRGFGLAITNLTKIAGVVVTVNETLIRTELRPIALAVAALMIAGAQGLETVLDKLLGK